MFPSPSLSLPSLRSAAAEGVEETADPDPVSISRARAEASCASRVTELDLICDDGEASMATAAPGTSASRARRDRGKMLKQPSRPTVNKKFSSVGTQIDSIIEKGPGSALKSEKGTQGDPDTELLDAEATISRLRSERDAALQEVQMARSQVRNFAELDPSFKQHVELKLTDDSSASDVSSSLVAGFTDPGSGSDNSDKVPIEDRLGMGSKVTVRNIPPSWDIPRLATAIDEIDRGIEVNHIGIQCNNGLPSL